MGVSWRTLGHHRCAAMSRQPDRPLRALTEPERDLLGSISRSRTEPAEHVTRAKALLEVAEGASFSEAARRVVRRSGEAVATLAARFNDEGPDALAPRRSPGRPPTYSDKDRARILAEFERPPDREGDGTATWSLVTLRDALRRAPDQSLDRTATLGSRFDFNLTPNWKIAGRTGYDFEAKEITTTDLSILRDLHCWEMSFNWVPFGRYKSFGFSIYVKSGYLRDLLRLEVPKRDVDRLGSLGL